MSQTKVNVGMIDATSIGDAKLLQGDGAWVTPAAASGDGHKFINTTDISDAATYNFTAFDASSYDGYSFLLQNVVPATDDVKFEGRTSTDGGSSYDDGASDYRWWSNLWTYSKDDADNSIMFQGSTVVQTAYKIGSDTNENGVNGWIWIMGPHLTGYTTVRSELGVMASDPLYAIVSTCFGVRLEAADVDGFQLFFSSGNIESGTITVYGLANA